MKIVLINNLYKPYARGGTEKVIAITAEALKHNGHEVCVLSSCPWLDRKNSTDKDNIIFYPFNFCSYYNLKKCPKILRPIWHFINLFNFVSYWQIKKILHTQKPDLVITHNLIGIGFLTPLAVKSLNIKHIHALHDIQLLHPSGLMFLNEENKINRMWSRIYQWFVKKFFYNVNSVISPSRWLLHLHTEKDMFTKAQKILMPNPTTFKDDSSAQALPTVAAPADKFIFLYVGQLEVHKGVNLLIDAFVGMHNDNCELWVVGEGAQANILKAKVNIQQYSHIKFFGKKNALEVLQLMKQASCLVMPSLCYENQPTVILEASQVNLPVLASNLGGVSEMLPQNCLFKAGNVANLSHKMAEIASSPSKIKPANFFGTDTQIYIDKILSL